MIRALIADDEPLSRLLVRQLLERHTDVSIVAECADGDAVRDELTRQKIDVLFLDVQMPLATGLELAMERDAANGPVVIFVSAYEQFALPAFAVDAADYLTKPIVESRFDAALGRVRSRLAQRKNYLARLISHSGSRDIVIDVTGVEYIKADGVYALVIAGGKGYLVRTSLDTLEEKLDPTLFVRVHRSYIVRTAQVAEIGRGQGTAGAVVLKNGLSIPVSRRRKDAVRALVNGSVPG